MRRERPGVPASGTVRRATSDSASCTRARETAYHDSVVAPQAATIPALTTSPRERRARARAAIAAIQKAVYQAGHRPGACQSSGASTIASAASAGASHGFPPRPGFRSSRPALAPASSVAAAARKSVTCQASHNSTDAPWAGNEIPRARSRRRNGPNDATASTPSAGSQRPPYTRTPARPSAKKPSSATALVSDSAATDPDSGPRTGA